MKKTALILLLWLVNMPVFAAYVTDTFAAPLRSGQTNAYRIIAELRSGTEVQVLERNEDSGYSNVRTLRGTEGWILSRYLVEEPIARQRLAQLERRHKELTSEHQALRQQYQTLQQNAAASSEQSTTLQQTNSALSKELDYIKEISANTLSINQRNQQLIEENQQLQNQLDLLTADNDRLKNDIRTDFFLYGAGVIILGLVLGLAIPSMKPKRKDTGWV